MNKIIFNISEVSTLLDIPIDTLRYYDKVSLLTPSKNPLNNYRSYTIIDLCILDYIKFLRNLDLSIKDIKNILTTDSTSQREILEKHHKLILEKIQFFKSLESKLTKSLSYADKLENSLNTNEIVDFSNMYLKKLGVMSYFGLSSCTEIKNNLLKEAKSTSNIYNNLFYTLSSEQPNKNDLLLECYIKVDKDAHYDIDLDYTTYMQRIIKTTDSSFTKDYSDLFSYAQNKDFLNENLILIKFLDTTIFFLQCNESIIEVLIPFHNK